MKDNEYEKRRQAKIAQNKAKLAQLGLLEASTALTAASNQLTITLDCGHEFQPRKKRRVAAEVNADFYLCYSLLIETLKISFEYLELTAQIEKLMANP